MVARALSTRQTLNQHGESSCLKFSHHESVNGMHGPWRAGTVPQSLMTDHSLLQLASMLVAYKAKTSLVALHPGQPIHINTQLLHF